MVSAEAYRELVERLEIQAQQAPGRYRFKLAMLALLGYGVLGLSVLLALSFTLGLLVVVALTNSWIILAKFFKLLIIPLGLAWVILRALLVRIPPPEGVRLARNQAPALHEEVERLRRAAGAPRLSGIIIDAEFNAAAVSMPRLLGFFGNRHYLVLGLPLMRLLTPPQLAAVIAYEFGHFGGGHGRFAGWIYRVRESWFRLLQALAERRAMASGLYVRFFDWYAPYFNAYSFVLARANEYEADAVAAEVTDKSLAGAALTQVALGADRLGERFWPEITRLNSHQADPPSDLFEQMSGLLTEADPTDRDRLGRILQQKADLNDTHPSLRQRLTALGVEPVIGASLQCSASEALLGELAPELERRFSQEWAAQVNAAWQENFQAAAQGRQRLAELEQAEQQGALSADEAAEHACLVCDLRPELDAVPLLETALARSPDHAMAQFRLGELRLERNDERGVDNLRRAMALDNQAAEAVLHRLGAHYHAAGNQQALTGISQELDRFYATLDSSQAERESIKRSDELIPHDLDPAMQEQLRTALDQIGGVARFWLARKPLTNELGQPHYIGLVNWKGIVVSENRRLQKLVEGLPLTGTFLLITSSYNGHIQRHVKKAAGKPIYPAPNTPTR